MDVTRTKVFRVVLLAIHCHLNLRILPSKSGLKLIGNVNIVYGNLKSENSRDYAQKPQRNCTFMNSASDYATQRAGGGRWQKTVKVGLGQPSAVPV